LQLLHPLCRISRQTDEHLGTVAVTSLLLYAFCLQTYLLLYVTFLWIAWPGYQGILAYNPVARGIGERLIRMSMSHPQVATRSSLVLVYPQDDRIVAQQLLHLQSKDKQHENPTQNIISVGMEQC
jgi:hypothetical protein